MNPRRPCLDDPVAAQPDGSTGECPTDRVDHTGEHHSQDLTRIQIVSGGLFFAVAIWGVVDAIRNFQSEVTIGETLAEPPPTTSLRIDPLLTPLAQGASVTLTF